MIGRRYLLGGAILACTSGQVWTLAASEGDRASGASAIDQFLSTLWDLGAELNSSNKTEAAAFLKNAYVWPFRPALDKLLAQSGQLDNGMGVQLIEEIQRAIKVDEVAPIDGFLVPADLQRMAVYVFHKRRWP